MSYGALLDEGLGVDEVAGDVPDEPRPLGVVQHLAPEDARLRVVVLVSRVPPDTRVSQPTPGVTIRSRHYSTLVSYNARVHHG